MFSFAILRRSLNLGTKRKVLSNGYQLLDVLGQERECSNMSSPSTPLMSDRSAAIIG